MYTKVFSFEKNKNILFITSIGKKRETEKYIKKSWCIPTRMSFVFAWQTIMALKVAQLIRLSRLNFFPLKKTTKIYFSLYQLARKEKQKNI